MNGSKIISKSYVIKLHSPRQTCKCSTRVIHRLRKRNCNTKETSIARLHSLQDPNSDFPKMRSIAYSEEIQSALIHKGRTRVSLITGSGYVVVPSGGFGAVIVSHRDAVPVMRDGAPVGCYNYLSIAIWISIKPSSVAFR